MRRNVISYLINGDWCLFFCKFVFLKNIKKNLVCEIFNCCLIFFNNIFFIRKILGMLVMYKMLF